MENSNVICFGYLPIYWYVSTTMENAPKDFYVWNRRWRYHDMRKSNPKPMRTDIQEMESFDTWNTKKDSSQHSMNPRDSRYSTFHHCLFNYKIWKRQQSFFLYQNLFSMANVIYSYGFVRNQCRDRTALNEMHGYLLKLRTCERLKPTSNITCESENATGLR